MDFGKKLVLGVSKVPASLMKGVFSGTPVGPSKNLPGSSS